MNAAEPYADRFLLGLDLMEDPWGAARPEAGIRPASMPGSTGLHVAAGLWGVFLATAIWWSYALVTAAPPVVAIAQAN